MTLAVVHTRAKIGVQAPPVVVETHLSNGLPGFSIVGLPEAAVKESRDRVRSAIINARFEFPIKRITINLAPADLPKSGGRYDLPIALGILAASGQIPAEALEHYECLGELALTGELRRIDGVLPASMACRDSGKALLVPSGCANEAALPRGATVFGADTLTEACKHIKNIEKIDKHQYSAPKSRSSSTPDLADVKHQHQAKRALTIAAAGGHSLLFYGPPGTGKSMLASRLPGILPPLSEPEMLELAAIHSVAALHGREDGLVTERPFRNPHHTASAVALVGGGSNPRPGEISLAHHGVLFLDEIPEYDRKVLEVLREPLENGNIVISRANQQVTYQAQFQLVAAMNPCPCGYHGAPQQRCQCSPEQVKRYRNRLSGPILDRIDLQVEVPALPKGTLSEQSNANIETSADIRERVINARQAQIKRQSCNNASLGPKAIDTHCKLTTANANLLENALERIGLSARAFHRILRVARTIADLDGAEQIDTAHLLEAINYRNLDRDKQQSQGIKFGATA